MHLRWEAVVPRLGDRARNYYWLAAAIPCGEYVFLNITAKYRVLGLKGANGINSMCPLNRLGRRFPQYQNE